ncbi:MAG TPA: PAS domain-containing sensor histidine kinase [Candidatus Saccharimonadales bacterium]|nr:PAS domain-containing sensor histidine kinase [Candidatus Saccharimonadales bacterium]
MKKTSITPDTLTAAAIPTAASAQARALADALFFSIGDGAILTDIDGRISKINREALDILGYKEKEVLNQPFLHVIRSTNAEGEPIDPLDRPITQAFVTGKTISTKSYYIRKDGKIIPAFITVSPIILNNLPTGALQVFRDITVEEEIDLMKSEFISIASHQLRAPLTAVKTYAHLLTNGYAGPLNSEQQAFIDIVLASADHMNSLIDTFLDVSKIETGKLKIEAAVISPKKLLEEVLQEFTPIAKQGNVTLLVEADTHIPAKITADPLLTKEIYTNLLSNAIKYTPAKGNVRIGLERQKGNLVFSVTDTGYGIPSSQQDKIFQKFFRASNAASVEASGSGLGLYLSKRIAENMGGDLRFNSREGQGTTFYFIQPLQPRKE